MRKYNCLSFSKFISNDFHLEPIRDEDKFEIMTIRNEQIYHLRQAKPLTLEDQKNYFSNVVSKLFEQDFPNQLLFSFFYKNEFIGYGGLVHINWIDKNAEISFVMKTKLEQDFFTFYWSNCLKLIEKVAFEEMKFHKIFTYAFDLRPHLYEMLLDSNYKEESRLKEHCFFENKYIDVVIHSKINNEIKFRKPTLDDAQLYFDWANDKSVRSNSYRTSKIDFETHINWFTSKLKDENCFMYLFQNETNEFIGQVRIQKQDDFSSIIGVSIDANQRGKGYANKIIEIASNDFLSKNDKSTIDAYIKEENIASAKGFKKAGFILKEMTNYENVKSFHYTKNTK
jgi:RimJ/RimL family protein N-acetyltransferase